MPAWGARPTLSGVRFGLWAPALEFVDLLIEGEIELLRLQRGDDGWHSLTTPRARAGSRYWYVLPDGTRIPDPASAFQPEGSDGPSQVVDHSAYRWRDARWRGLPWHTAVIHEIDIGAFSAAGTFSGAREHLRALVRLGVTAVQLRAVGVSPYVPDRAHGTPDDLRAFVEEAHGLGLMVLLDLAYRHHTLWGAALDFESRAVRDLVVGNALQWLEKYHLDGLRLDDLPKDILTGIAEAVRARVTQRQVHLTLKKGNRFPALLERSRYGEVQLYNAQFNDREGLQQSAHLPPDAFISFVQDDDLPEPALRAHIAIQLLMPQIPLIGPAKLDWQASESLEARRWRERYGWLLELRHREIIPRIPSIEQGGSARQITPTVIEVTWQVGASEDLILLANLGDGFVDAPVPRGRVLWLEGSRGGHGGLHAWSVVWIVRPRAS